MQHLLLYCGIIVIVALATLPSQIAAAVECYNCVALKPNWGQEKCLAGSTKKNCVFCTKAEFGGSLVVRGCVRSGTEKLYTNPLKMCKTYKTYFDGDLATEEMKQRWKDHKRYYDDACTNPKPGPKTPKKGYVCKKKLCNSAHKVPDHSFALLVGVITFLGARCLYL